MSIRIVIKNCENESNILMNTVPEYLFVKWIAFFVNAINFYNRELPVYS